jgi:hypothetical protein
MVKPSPAIDSSYLAHFSNLRLLNQIKKKKGRQAVSATSLSEQIPLPPLDEQRRIAAIMTRRMCCAASQTRPRLLGMTSTSRFSAMFASELALPNSKFRTLGEVCD